MKILFIEPPKDHFFLMGEYLPPPYGIIQLAAFLEREVKNADIEILDCNAKQVDWREMEKRIGSSSPDIVASRSLATYNTCVAHVTWFTRSCPQKRCREQKYKSNSMDATEASMDHGRGSCKESPPATG